MLAVVWANGMHMVVDPEVQSNHSYRQQLELEP